MLRLCLLLPLLLAACRQGAALEPSSAAAARPRPARAAPPRPPLPVDPPVAYQSPEPECANVEPIRVGAGIQRPELLRRVEPVFPQGQIGVMGTLILELVVDARGRVCTVRVFRGLGPSVDPAVVDAVRQWTFRPARLRGRPVAVAYMIAFSPDVIQ